MKYVYEYTQAKKPKVRWELAYFDDTNHSLDEPRTSGYDAYTYDDQDRQQKQETYTESGGAFHLTHIEEIAEYDTETGLPAVIYTYDVDEQDPDATVPDGSPTVKKSGMSEVSAHWRKSFSLNSRFTIQPMFYGRLLFGSIVPAVFGNTIGGEWFGHYVEQQMPFAGIGNMECGPLFRVCTASGTAAYWRQQLCIASPGRSPTGQQDKGTPRPQHHAWCSGRLLL